MVSSCASLRMAGGVLFWWGVMLLVVTSRVEGGGERNVQHFVKIDVAKINVKNTTDASGNVSSTTPIGETSTETTITTSSTTEGTTASSATASTTSKPGPTVAVESSTASTSTTAPTTASTDVSYPTIPAGRAAKLVPKGYYCRCDLTINICDINCCCDIDCNAAILRTFDCDQEVLHTEEYHHDEGLQSCRVQGGLFCLVEPIYEEGDDSFYNPGRLPAATRYKWRDVFPVDSSTTSEETVRSNHYHVDDEIYFYNETSELVQPFAIPYPLTGSSCQIEQPVRFLRDRTNLCRRNMDELSDFNRAFVRHAASSARFFQTPKKSTVMEHYCMEDGDCLNATVSICYQFSLEGWNCTQSSGLSNTSSSVEELSDEDPDSVCLELQIRFVHNYTNLLNVEIKLLCKPERSYEVEPPWTEPLWQRITVRFIVPTTPSKPNSTRAISGNIGYLVGKPLIVSHLEFPKNGTNPVGDTSPENPPNRMLAYFTNETRLPDTTFRLRLPISRRNRCQLTEDEHKPINFGTDSYHRCNYIPAALVNQTTGSSQNYTKFCLDLQAGLYAHLLSGIYPEVYPTKGEGYDKLNLYLSKYGNPLNRTAEWVRVRSSNVIADAAPGSEATPSTDSTDSYFTCTNMLINVDYRFYYARTRVRDVRHQAVVHDAEIVFGPRVNLRFRLEEEIRVPIFIQVQFFDLTSSSGKGVWQFAGVLFGFGVVFVMFALGRGQLL